MMKKPFLQFKKSYVLSAVALVIPLTFSLIAQTAHASLRLQSSVVIVNQSDGEGVISLQNNSSEPVLLHSEILNVPEDDADLLLITPPITRVDPEDTQMVRFILKDTDDLKTERLKRVTFEGIPQTEPNVVRVTVRQNIPVIIRPTGLAPNNEPWKLLKWHNTADSVVVENPSPYVIRLLPDVTAQPSGATLTIPKSYILPGEKLTLNTQTPHVNAEKIAFKPASINGYLLDSREALVEGQAKK